MHRLRLTLVVASAILAASPAAAAKSDDQIWTTAVATVKLAPKWRLQEEVAVRFSDNRHGLYEVEANTLVGYVLAKGITLWGGYTHDPQYSAGHFTILERR